MRLTIRPLDLADDAQLAAWQSINAANEVALWGVTHQPTLEQLRIVLRPETPYQRLYSCLVRADDVPVALGAVILTTQENVDDAFLLLGVHAAHRGRGIGTQLCEHLVAVAREAGRRTLSGWAEFPYSAQRPGNFSDTGAGRLAARWAMTWRAQAIGRLLRLPVDPALLDALWAQAAPAFDGYTIASWTGPIPEKHFAAYGLLLRQLDLDEPLEDLQVEAAKYPPERLRYVNERNASLGKQSVTAVAVAPDGTMVGNSVLEWRADPDDPLVEQENTLVMPAHRGHRLGLGMKVTTHRLLTDAAPDKSACRTSNAEINSPMVAINEALGYVPVTREVAFQGRLTR